MNLEKFYNSIRKNFKLTTTNIKGFDLLLKEAENQKIPLFYLAYILATVWHETAHTMQPIAEYGKGKGRKYGIVGKYGQVPYGRGYVQLTWDENYEKADKKLNLKGALLKDFNLAMKPEIASKILFIGMLEGWFTGKSLKDYIDNVDESDEEDLREYSNARRIINGTDKQVMIGQYALKFEKALKDSGYRFVATHSPVQPIKEVPSVVQPPKAKTSLLDLLVTAIIYLFQRR